MKILIQFEKSVQVTEDSYRVKRVSNAFDSDTPLIEVIKWAIKNNEMKQPHPIEILQFTEL